MFGSPGKRKRKRLEERGVRAPATVLGMSRRMAVTSGPDNLVGSTEVDARFHLRIEPPDGDPIETHARMRFPQLSVPQEGSRVMVIYDPDDPSDLMWDDSGPGIAALVGDESGAIGDLINLALSGAGQDDLVRAAQGLEGVRIVTHEQSLSGSDGAGLAADIERLAALHRSGALTDEEFAAAKARLLGGQPGSE